MADKNIKVCYGLETAGIQIIFHLSGMAVAGAPFDCFEETILIVYESVN